MVGLAENQSGAAGSERKKLIEVSLPLETINAESAREKSIRHGHPSTLHLWWARRPLAAARAVLFAQLVDDPSARPDEYPTEEDQKLARKKLHHLIEDLVRWENIGDEELFAEAHAEIMKSTGGNPPPILDPFAGGGSIPLEAQRLGLEAHASDLNPVAVLINKALIEIPPKFRDRPPVFPGLPESQIRTWEGAQGLAADVRAYGEWMRDEAEKRIGHLYPKATLPDGSTANVIAWIWARTITCPNPGCGIEMPLVRSWWLGKKKGKEAYVVPEIVDDPSTPSSRRVEFRISHDFSRAPTAEVDGTMSGRKGAVCVACQSSVDVDYVRAEGIAGRLGPTLMAVVAEGPRGRVYLKPTAEHERAARVSPPAEVIDGDIATNARWFSPPMYGLTRFADLFTSRQLVALTTFSDLVAEVRERVHKDALAAGIAEGDRLDMCGSGAAAYADAVATYMGLGVSRTADLGNSLVTWSSSRDQSRNLFARQAIPMAWDFVEVSPFAGAAGDVSIATATMAGALSALSAGGRSKVRQGDAVDQVVGRALISTDPPYYDNIGYSDLSDFFYVWLRRSLRDVHPRLLATMLVPKMEELVANPYRHGSRDKASEFFEEGFRRVFARARESALPEYPITVFYAFKQTETTKDGQSSTGWETLLEGMIRSGWQITSTWPMRSERGGRMLSVGTNALASSIVLSLRPRSAGAPRIDRRGFVAALKAELPAKLRDLQEGRIAPVDLPQAAIGPGMAIYSKYSAVLESDGSRMPVKAALARINAVLDEVLQEQEGDFDPATRFAIVWYCQHGYGTGKFGDADNLARARNTSVDGLQRAGLLTGQAGKVALFPPSALDPEYDPFTDQSPTHWELVQHLIRLLRDEVGGVAAAGQLLARSQARPDGVIDTDLAKELAFLLFRVADGAKRSADAQAFNDIATAWNDIVEAARVATGAYEQGMLGEG